MLTPKWRLAAMIAVLPMALVAQSSDRASTNPVPMHWSVTASGNQARFIVREQLAGADLSNDAIGTTAAISGGVVLNAQGQPDAAVSRITVDLRTLTSDKPNRDSYIKRRTLVTDSFPDGVFIPTRLTLSNGDIHQDGPIAGTLGGIMTLHNASHAVSWSITGVVAGDTVSGRAVTHVQFGDFAMERPHLMIVLSVVDDIRLEYDFRLVRGTAR
jgi:hypothetical protein